MKQATRRGSLSVRPTLRFRPAHAFRALLNFSIRPRAWHTDNASWLVEDYMPEMSDEELGNALQLAITEANL